MTFEERAKPDILNARRRQRIARGSGTTVTEVNEIISRFNEMRKMMKQMPRLQKMMSRKQGKGLFSRG
jgi:signal recognition particle subunit SRP54